MTCLGVGPKMAGAKEKSSRVDAHTINDPCVSEAQDASVTFPTHPLGSRARILLASVFGPYAQDDEYGSRAVNPMELFHNQVTRVQRAFSLRMFHRSWGLMLIQANLSRSLKIGSGRKIKRKRSFFYATAPRSAGFKLIF